MVLNDLIELAEKYTIISVYNNDKFEGHYTVNKDEQDKNIPFKYCTVKSIKTAHELTTDTGDFYRVLDNVLKVVIED